MKLTKPEPDISPPGLAFLTPVIKICTIFLTITIFMSSSILYPNLTLDHDYYFLRFMSNCEVPSFSMKKKAIKFALQKY